MYVYEKGFVSQYQNNNTMTIVKIRVEEKTKLVSLLQLLKAISPYEIVTKFNQRYNH